MSGYIKGNVRPHLAISRVLNSDTLDHRFHIGSYEAGMNHVVVDAHSQRHPVLGGEREGPLQQHQGGAEQQSGVDGNQGDDENAAEGDEHEGEENQDDDGQGNNHAGNNINGVQPLLPPRSASPYVRGRGHDPYGLFAAEAESKRRRAAKKAKWLARREVGRLRRWEEWRKGVWEPLVPPA
ncbi:hypothetical protein KC331_g6067 [Hortaea werneckii]|nr:hypothetical protein KC331_g6067 [Hortaea werneckii]KAI7712897.1 hypothetical protein KC353_g7934 [Hortaea werneckii]